jgi:hypothetical protein
MSGARPFVQAIVFAYKMTDNGEDPPEWRVENPEQRTTVASAASQLLGRINRIPGTDENGRIDAPALSAWVVEVRRICREYARAKVGDSVSVNFLPSRPEGVNGTWPCEAICEAMEGISPRNSGGDSVRRSLAGGKGAYRSASLQRNTVLGLSACASTIPMSRESSTTLPPLMSAKPAGRIPKRRSRRGSFIDFRHRLHAPSQERAARVGCMRLLGALTRSLAHSENQPFLPAPSNRTDEPLQ